MRILKPLVTIHSPIENDMINHHGFSCNGQLYYIVYKYQSGQSIKKIRTSQARTKKSCTFSHEKWSEVLNPIIRGKANYMMNVVRAQQEVANQLEIRGYKSKCVVGIEEAFKRIDGYIRQRLRVALIHKNPNRRKATMRKHQFNNVFFLIQMGLVSVHYMLNKYRKKELSVQEYNEDLYNNIQINNRRYVASLKEKGKQYYTETRIKRIAMAKAHRG